MHRLFVAIILGFASFGNTLGQTEISTRPAESKRGVERTQAGTEPDAFGLKIAFGVGILVLGLTCVGSMLYLRHRQSISGTNAYRAIVFLGTIFTVILLVIAGISPEGLAAVTARTFQARFP